MDLVQAVLARELWEHALEGYPLLELLKAGAPHLALRDVLEKLWELKLWNAPAQEWLNGSALPRGLRLRGRPKWERPDL